MHAISPRKCAILWRIQKMGHAGFTRLWLYFLTNMLIWADVFIINACDTHFHAHSRSVFAWEGMEHVFFLVVVACVLMTVFWEIEVKNISFLLALLQKPCLCANKARCKNFTDYMSISPRFSLWILWFSQQSEIVCSALIVEYHAKYGLTQVTLATM